MQAVDITAYDAIPFITRVPTQFADVFQVKFGILLHGDLTFDASFPVIASGSCGTEFLYEYDVNVVNGEIQVTATQQYFDPPAGKSLTCDIVREALIGDSQGNGFMGKPPILTGGIIGKLQGFFTGLQSLGDLGRPVGLGVAAGLVGSAVSCTPSAGGAPTCAGTIPFLLAAITAARTLWACRSVRRRPPL